MLKVMCGTSGAGRWLGAGVLGRGWLLPRVEQARPAPCGIHIEGSPLPGGSRLQASEAELGHSGAWKIPITSPN